MMAIARKIKKKYTISINKYNYKIRIKISITMVWRCIAKTAAIKILFLKNHMKMMVIAIINNKNKYENR